MSLFLRKAASTSGDHSRTTTPDAFSFSSATPCTLGERLSIQAILAWQAVWIWARSEAGRAAHLSLRIRKSSTAEGCCQPGR